MEERERILKRAEAEKKRRDQYKKEKHFIKETVLSFITFQIMALEDMLRKTGYYLELLGPLSRCRHDIMKLLDVKDPKKGNRDA